MLDIRKPSPAPRLILGCALIVLVLGSVQLVRQYLAWEDPSVNFYKKVEQIPIGASLKDVEDFLGSDGAAVDATDHDAILNELGKKEPAARAGIQLQGDEKAVFFNKLAIASLVFCKKWRDPKDFQHWVIFGFVGNDLHYYGREGTLQFKLKIGHEIE
jgi:hypothetical protein